MQEPTPTTQSNLLTNNLPTEYRELEQYFFTPKTRETLAKLVEGHHKIALLFAPSLGAHLEKLNPDIDYTVLDLDQSVTDPKRFAGDDTLAPIPTRKYQIYDADRGLHSKHTANSRELSRLHLHQYDGVVVDPPYQAVTPGDIARNANALLDFNPGSKVLVAHLATAEEQLRQAFAELGFEMEEVDQIEIAYNQPPRPVLRKGVKLWRFTRKSVNY